MRQQYLVVVTLLIFLVITCRPINGSIKNNLVEAVKPVQPEVKISLAGVTASSSLVWSPTGTLLAINAGQTGIDANIYLLDSVNPHRKPYLLDQGSKFMFSGDGTKLFVLAHGTEDDNTVRAWDARTHTLQFEFPVPKLRVTEMVVNQAGDLLALANDTRAGESGGIVKLYDTRNGTQVFAQKTAGMRTNVGLDRTGSIVTVTTESTCVRGAASLDLLKWQMNESLPTLSSASETSLAFSPMALGRAVCRTGARSGCWMQKLGCGWAACRASRIHLD